MTVFLKSYRQPDVYVCLACNPVTRQDILKPIFVDARKELLVCSACKSAAYCSAECQKADWRNHKSDCRVISANLSREGHTEITAKNLQPLCDGACEHFSELAAERQIPCTSNMVYVVFCGRNNRYFSQVELFLRFQQENRSGSQHLQIIPGFAQKFLHRRYREMYGYLHTADEIYDMKHVHPDVKAAVAKIFALGVPNTRVMIRFHRDRGAVSVSAGTKALSCPAHCDKND